MSSLRKLKIAISTLLTTAYFSLPLSLLANSSIGASTSSPPPRLCEIVNIIERLINIALGAGGLMTFIMIIFGAVSWITAGADDKKLSQAQSTITWGIIGLVLLLGSFFILALIQSFTGVKLTAIQFPWIGSVGSLPTVCQ